MYIRARLEAIKIAEKAGPAVIIWFRPLAISRPESDDIPLGGPFPDDDGARSRPQPARGGCPGWRRSGRWWWDCGRVTPTATGKTQD